MMIEADIGRMVLDVPSELKRQFAAISKLKGETMTGLVRDFMIKYVENNGRDVLPIKKAKSRGQRRQ